MIRLFVVVGVVLVAALSYLVINVGPEKQLPPAVTLLERFEAEGVVPGPNEVTEDEEMEHGIFEVPEEDEARLEAAEKAAGTASMPGMDMGDADGDGDAGDRTAAEGDAESMTGADGKPMAMAGAEGEAGDMTAADGEAETMAGADGEAGDMTAAEGGAEAMAGADGKPMQMDMGEGGLLIAEDGGFDREIDLTMDEWKFSQMKIDVKMGERIRFTVKNGGQIPHEFMFMTMPAMTAITYRARRADWSLVEHEALYEKSLVLPGGEFSFVVKVMQPGTWMFMCMLPYHMQMGMMGQMATKGMAMRM